MATLTVGDMKKIVAKYLDDATLADYITSGVDLLLIGMNNARRFAEKIHDFTYSQADTTLAIASTGTLLTAAAVSIKNVNSVSLPVAGSEYMPIEFLTNDEWVSRTRKQIGRAEYSATATLADLGVSNRNVLCYQNGRTLFLYPGSSFSFPITVRLNVVKFLADYSADGDTDFFLEFGPDFIQWQTIFEVNKIKKCFAERTEGNISSEEVDGNAKAALQSLLQWDASLSGGTSTPQVEQPYPRDNRSAPRK